MKALLDTHALIWWFEGSERLSPDARTVIENEENEIIVSAASAWEIATKVRLGKLSWAAPLLENFTSKIEEQAFRLLGISVAHALTAGSLSGTHRDPFDRMLMAQALGENAALISNEATFDIYGVRRLW